MRMPTTDVSYAVTGDCCCWSQLCNLMRTDGLKPPLLLPSTDSLRNGALNNFGYCSKRSTGTHTENESGIGQLGVNEATQGHSSYPL